MTIRQFAEEQHVSYEAIRQQVSTHRKALEGHIVRNKQQKLLDEYAVDYLRKIRRQSPTIMINQDREQTIDALKNELLRAQNTITQLQQQVDALKDQRREMIEIETRYKMSLTVIEEKDRIIKQHDQEAQDAKAEAHAAQQALVVEREKYFQTKADLQITQAQKEAAEKEAASFQKSIFGFYRKKG